MKVLHSNSARIRMQLLIYVLLENKQQCLYQEVGHTIFPLVYPKVGRKTLEESRRVIKGCLKSDFSLHSHQ